jgi:hypothetical protein
MSGIKVWMAGEQVVIAMPENPDKTKKSQKIGQVQLSRDKIGSVAIVQKYLSSQLRIFAPMP